MAGEYICPDFNLTIAAGWGATLETDGRVDVLPTDEKGPGLHFEFAGGAAGTAEEAVAAVIAAEKGSPMGTATVNDVEFKTTTYSKGGMPHTVYVGLPKRRQNHDHGRGQGREDRTRPQGDAVDGPVQIRDPGSRPGGSPVAFPPRLFLRDISPPRRGLTRKNAYGTAPKISSSSRTNGLNPDVDSSGDWDIMPSIIRQGGES